MYLSIFIYIFILFVSIYIYVLTRLDKTIRRDDPPHHHRPRANKSIYIHIYIYMCIYIETRNECPPKAGSRPRDPTVPQATPPQATGDLKASGNWNGGKRCWRQGALFPGGPGEAMGKYIRTWPDGARGVLTLLSLPPI